MGLTTRHWERNTAETHQQEHDEPTEAKKKRCDVVRRLRREATSTAIFLDLEKEGKKKWMMERRRCVVLAREAADRISSISLMHFERNATCTVECLHCLQR